jgi:hypothetical protein
MDAKIRVDVDADDLIKKLHDDRWSREPLRVALNKVGRMGETDSKRRAPVDDGRLKAGITHQVDNQPLMMSVDIGVIGSVGELPYAKYMEYGTGLTHDHPNWPRRRHTVHPSMLANWGPVKQKLVKAGAAAFFINRRGGLKPRRYLRGMLEDSSSKFIAIIRRAVREMEL